jgi:phosphatidylserine synthase
MFGAVADKVSDTVTCGIAPAVVLVRSQQKPQGALPGVAAAAYLAACAWRTKRTGIGPRRSHVFHGLPDVGAGILFALCCKMKMSPRALTYLTLAMSAGMVSRVRILSGEALLAKMLKRAPSANWPT